VQEVFNLSLAAQLFQREAVHEQVNLEASQAHLGGFNETDLTGLRAPRGANPRPSLVKPAKAISAKKASPAANIPPKAQKADNISSYETGIDTIQNELLWTLSEENQTSPMSPENYVFSEEVASFGGPLRVEQQSIRTAMTIDSGQIQKAPVGKSLIQKATLHAGKKILTKGNTLSIPEDTTMMATDQDWSVCFPGIADMLGEGQTLEMTVPVVDQPPQTNLNEEWNLKNDLPPLNEDDYMMPVNPYDAEGFDPFEEPVEDSKAELDPLRDAMESCGLPTTNDNAEEFEFNFEEDFDPNNIVSMVLNDDVSETDEAFLNLVKTDDNSHQVKVETSTINYEDIAIDPQPSTSKAAYSAIKREPEDFDNNDPDFAPTPAKRPRGRPRIQRPESDLPRRPRGRPPTASSYADVTAYEDTSGMSSNEIKDIKYRRMRDLNNAASKRCRLNRKMKFDKMEQEEAVLVAKNTQLKAEVAALESSVKRFKELVLGMVKTKSETQQQQQEAIQNFDIDKLVEDTIESMKKN